MISEEAKKIIEDNALALATITDKGEPYVIGVAGCKVKDDKIVITDNYMKSTVENIKRIPKVALVVWDKKMNGYQFLGQAEYFNDGDWVKYVKGLKENKDTPAKGAVIVEVNKVIKSA